MSLLTEVTTSSNADVVINQNFDTVAAFGLYGWDAMSQTGLTMAYFGGIFPGAGGDVTVTAGTVALTDASTNYIVAHLTTGVVSAATSTTNWDDDAVYGRMFSAVTSGGAITSWTDYRRTAKGVMRPGGPNSGAAPVESIIVAASDETTALTAGAAKVTFRMPYAFTLTGVRCSLTTAQTSGSIFTVDVNEAGTSVLSTKLTIDNTEKTSTTAATAAVISDAALADDAEITVDIDQAGDGTAKGLKVALIGTRA
jgi:hypothetical protein